MNDFVGRLSSAEPTPGGGGAAALCGALSSALCNMVCNLTTGKKKYAEYQPEIDELLKSIPKMTKHLMDDIEKDAENDLQKVHDKFIAKLDALIEDKNKEIMTV